MDAPVHIVFIGVREEGGMKYLLSEVFVFVCISSTSGLKDKFSTLF